MTGIKSSYSVQSAVRRSRMADTRKNWPLAGLKREDYKEWDWDDWVDIDWFEDQWYDQDALCCRCSCELHRDPQPHSADMSKRVTIDRQNSDEPHWKENCLLACWTCNTSQYAKCDHVAPPVRREMYTSTTACQEPISITQLMSLELKLSELTLQSTLMSIRRSISMQVNRVRGLYRHHKITPLECANLLRSPMYHTEVTESERTVLDRSKMRVKPVEVVTMKTAGEIMLE